MGEVNGMPPDGNLLLLRADGGPSIGAGHVMRCLALAHAWQDAGGRALLAAHQRPTFFDARLANEHVPTIDIDAAPGSQADAEMTVRIAREQGATWVAIDGYHFDARFQSTLRDAGVAVLVIDDEGDSDDYHANVLLNQNLHADPSMYSSVDPDTQVLLGPRYSLLRREFWTCAHRADSYPERARTLLVSLGGSDSQGLVDWMVDALKPLAEEGFHIVLVAALSEAHRLNLVRQMRGLKSRFRVMSEVRDMPELMARADLAVSAAGSTCWELAHMGVPALVLSLADNQRAVAHSLDQAGAAVDLGWHEDLDAGRLRDETRRLAYSASARRFLGETGRKMVDGEGGRRVAMIMRGDRIRLRPASAMDVTLLWKWVNDPGVRASALSQKPISLGEHGPWFAARMSDPDTFMFLALDLDDQPIGQVRFDLVRASEAEIDVSVVDARRGGGIGATLIEMGSQRLFRSTGVTRIHAVIRQGNDRSTGAFEQAGFRSVGIENVQGTQVAHWMLARGS